jgi:hypothetical protein
MAQIHDPTSKVTHYAGISQDFVGFRSLFYDSSYRWLAAGQHNLVQIDSAIWIPIAIALIGVAIFWARTGTRPDRSILAREVNVP